MNSNISELAKAARQAANSGNWKQAESLWQQVASIEPSNAQALSSLGMHSLHRGDKDKAFELLLAARNAAPRDFLVLLTLAAVHRQRNDAAGEREAIDAALRLGACRSLRPAARLPAPDRPAAVGTVGNLAIRRCVPGQDHIDSNDRSRARPRAR